MMEAYNQWKKNPTRENLQNVIDKSRKLIINETNKWAKGLAPELLYPIAESITIDAIKSYNPKNKTALSTHIVNNLQQLSRMAYKYQAAVRLPEYKLFKKFEFDRAKKELSMELSREPTIEELANRLKWSKAAVVKMHNSLLKGEGVESIDLPMLENESSLDLDYIYHSLDPVQQNVFRLSTGYNGSPVKSTKEIAKQLKLSEPQVYRIKTRIAEIIKEYKSKGF